MRYTAPIFYAEVGKNSFEKSPLLWGFFFVDLAFPLHDSLSSRVYHYTDWAMLPVWKFYAVSFHGMKRVRSKTPCSSWKNKEPRQYMDHADWVNAYKSQIGRIFMFDFSLFFPILPVCSHSATYQYLYTTKRSFMTSTTHSPEARRLRSSVTMALASHPSHSQSWVIRDTRCQGISCSIVQIYRQHHRQIAISLASSCHCRISQRSQAYAYLSISVRSTIHTLLVNISTRSRHLRLYSAVWSRSCYQDSDSIHRSSIVISSSDSLVVRNVVSSSSRSLSWSPRWSSSMR